MTLERIGHQLAAEDRDGLQQPAIGHLSPDRIFDRDPAGSVMLGGIDQRLHDGAVGRRGAENQIRHDRVKRGAGGLPPLAALELGIELELHRLENRHLDLRKHPAAHLRVLEPAEDGGLRSLDADGNDHGIRFVGDHGRAVVDLHQTAGDGDAAFRKDDQHVAGAYRVDNGAQRKRLERIERHGAHEFEERLDPPISRHGDVDGEDRPFRQDRKRQRRIEEAHVIECDNRVVSGLGDVIEAGHFEAEKRTEHDREKIVKPARRHGQADRHRDREIGEADQCEQNRRAVAELLQHGENDGAGDHEGGIEHIDRGDHAGAPIGAGPDLHGGEDRHDEQAAGNREAGEIDGDVEAVARGKKRPERHWARRRHDRRSGPAEVEREQPKENRGDQRRQQHDAAGREPGRKAGADCDRDRKDRQKQRHDFFAAADGEGDERRQQREDQRANEPEPAGDKRAPPQPRIGADVFDQRRRSRRAHCD